MNPFGLSCSQCPAFDPLKDTKEDDPMRLGMCRCNPPSAHVVPTRIATKQGDQHRIDSTFPPTRADGFCWEIIRLTGMVKVLQKSS